MKAWRRLGEEEFDREFAAVRNRVFGRRFWHLRLGTYPFPDQTWRIVPLPHHPLKHGRPGAKPPPGFPPVEPYFESYYQPLLNAVLAGGHHEVVVTNRGDGGVELSDGRYRDTRNWDSLTDAPKHFVFFPVIEFLHRVSIGLEGLLMYGTLSRAGDWGLISDLDGYNFSVLGGTPEFVDRFFRFAGGEGNVRAWFYYYLFRDRNLFFLGDHVGRNYEREHVENLLRMAGWPVPDWKTFGEGEIDWSRIMGGASAPRRSSCAAAEGRGRPWLLGPHGERLEARNDNERGAPTIMYVHPVTGLTLVYREQSGKTKTGRPSLEFQVRQPGRHVFRVKRYY